MVKPKNNDPSTEQLLHLVHQIQLLIEDNNQNIKDCYSTLKEIQKRLCPPKHNLIRRLIQKILNKNCVL
jgi:hypothetical protein